MTEFQRLYTGRLWSVLAWDQLTALWQRIDPAARWYLVAVGVSPAPTAGMVPAAAADVSAFINRIDALLRAEHHESYCGIVYADDLHVVSEAFRGLPPLARHRLVYTTLGELMTTDIHALQISAKTQEEIQ